MMPQECIPTQNIRKFCCASSCGQHISYYLGGDHKLKVVKNCDFLTFRLSFLLTTLCSENRQKSQFFYSPSVSFDDVVYGSPLITIFSNNHFKQKFHYKDIFLEKHSAAFNFGSYLELNSNFSIGDTERWARVHREQPYILSVA